MKIEKGQTYSDSDDHAWLIGKKVGRGCWEAESTIDNKKKFKNLNLQDIKQMTPPLNYVRIR